MSAEPQTLEPAGFERMSQREQREALRDNKREAFRSALWDLVASDIPSAEIRELINEEMSLWRPQ